jgi:hypothetical protein
VVCQELNCCSESQKMRANGKLRLRRMASKGMMKELRDYRKEYVSISSILFDSKLFFSIHLLDWQLAIQLI